MTISQAILSQPELRTNPHSRELFRHALNIERGKRRAKKADKEKG